MTRREELQELLEGILGSENVYFQPPSNVKMKYDCIRYERERIDPTFADNTPYQLHDRYRLTLIYKDPDSDIPHKLAALPKCRHQQHYKAENLNHDVFSLYF